MLQLRWSSEFEIGVMQLTGYYPLSMALLTSEVFYDLVKPSEVPDAHQIELASEHTNVFGSRTT